MIIIVVGMTIDTATEIHREADLAAGQLTPTDPFVRISAGIMTTVGRAVPVTAATGKMCEIDAIGLTEVEIPAAGLIRSNLQRSNVCVSVNVISIVCSQADMVRTIHLAGRERHRPRLEIVQRQS